MQDIYVESWIDLQRVLYDIPMNQNSHMRHRSDFAYRGVADRSWRLETSLYRLGGDFTKVEGPLLRSFKKYADAGTIKDDSLWSLLSIAQHHGLPTRVLDWTVAPKVAVHFATVEYQHFDKDAAIWRLNIAESRKVLPDFLRDVLREEHAFLFSVEMLNKHIATLKEFDTIRPDDPFVLFFEPPSLDARIINQWALLTAMPNPSLTLSDFLAAHPSLYDRVIIPKELKQEVRDKLDQDNVTERMLFPGLDGLSQWLKRYYGPMF
ncbi:FRG domain-containing protein [Aliikangiella maris]|uniref:FRG domain-containing protein n=2 Tax=Aliikangiella maris TaxID=3162458 RepID=A0ABV3MIZ2_9GAMM